MNPARPVLAGLLLVLLLSAAGTLRGRAQAQAQLQQAAVGARQLEPGKPQATPALGAYYEALRKRRLVQAETAKVETVRELLSAGERAAQAGRFDEAAVLLYELVESPRFSDYADEPELDAARYRLALALHELGAERSAQRYLRVVIERGPEAPYFAPAFRLETDVALRGLALPEVIAELGKLSIALPEDAQNELRYLRGREREAAGDDALARRAYGEITPRSRFYASAQYLLGAIASRQGRLGEAERHFCKIATAGDDDNYSFYVDERYFAIKDLARLALGRVAHEQGRADDAFYYYFQIPQDSARLPEAMFEAAYATYEGGDHETALDLLDQLQARFPHSAFADEASILRGYVALSSCDFDQASQLFSSFIARFTPVLAELDRILQSPSRREALYEELARIEVGASAASPARRSLLALVGVDPVFQDLHARLRKLDAEAARAARLPENLAMLAARLRGADAPRAAADPTPSAYARLEPLQHELEAGRQTVALLTEQLDGMRRLGAPGAQLAPLEQDLARLERRVSRVHDHLQELRWSLAPPPSASSSDAETSSLFARDLALAAGFERRVEQLRPRLVEAANARALAGVTALRTRLADFLRRARIGRIDAVMGSKRRIEIQIESLAAGRFPAELRDPLLVQGFLGDDEEYWPFEGEDWPDEYLEHYAPDHDPQPKAAAQERP